MTKLSAPEWVRINFSRFDIESDCINAGTEELGIKRNTVRDAVTKFKKKICKQHPITAVQTYKTSSSIGLSIEDIRNKHDVIYQIEKAITQIPKGRYIPDSEFREVFVKCSSEQYRAKSGLEKFSKNKGSAKGITYWGTTADIKRLKNEGILQ
jgi:hypothetical protein